MRGMIFIRLLLQMKPREGEQMGQVNPERKGHRWPLTKPAGSCPCPLCSSFLMPPRVRAFLSQRLCPCLTPARVLGCRGGGCSKAICGPLLTPISPAETRPEIALSILATGSHLGRLPCSIARVLSPLTCRGEGRSHARRVSHFPVSHLFCHPPPPIPC